MKTLIAVVIAGGIMAGCAKSPAPAGNQQATVTLKDGSTFNGTVTKNSTSEISLQAPTGETRTYPMAQVASVQYGADTSAPAPSQAVNAPPPVTAPPPVAAPAPPPIPAPAPQPAVVNAPPPRTLREEPIRREAPTPAPAAVEFRTIPAGTNLEVRNNEAIDSATADPGQTFSGVVARDVVDDTGRVAIPRGSNATLVVRSASGQGKLQGRSDLAVDVSSVQVGGRRYRLETRDFVETGRDGLGKNKRTGEFAGGGAALGGIIGAIAGGGKGAAIGALAGAGAGAGTQALTRGKGVRISPETIMTFRLEAPVKIRELR